MPKSKNPFKRRGVGFSADVRGQAFGLNVRRPKVNITREEGFEVRSRSVGPKKKKRIVI